MPITFGSVGDIISVCLIVKDLVDALDKSRGSATEYQEIIRELRCLDRSLLEVEKLSRELDISAELNALCVTAKHTVDKCRSSVDSFLAKVRKYEKYLREEGSGNVVKDSAMKMKWQIFRSSELAKFKVEVIAHYSSINALIANAQLKRLELIDTKLNERLSEGEHRETATAERQEAILKDIQDRVEENHRQVVAGNTTLGQIADSLKFQWLRNIGGELRSLMQKTFLMNVVIYRAVLSIQGSLLGSLERTLIQEPFILEDAIGRLCPVHLQFICSWEAFEDVLEHRFRGLQGHNMVLQKDWIIHEPSTCRDISRNTPWAAAFLPGQKVGMDLVFRKQAVIEMPDGTTSCPSCKAPSKSGYDRGVKCASCGLHYHRITEEHEKPNNFGNCPSREEDSQDLQMMKITESTKRQYKGLTVRVEEMSNFKRVRVSIMRVVNEKPLPNRVLDVRMTSSAYDTVRLCITNNSPAHYACLSYGWDCGSSGAKTTKATINEHCRGIPVSDLPTIIQNLIFAVRYLGLRFLWVSSLCIIQDDQMDIQREARQIGDIYKNSCFVISDRRKGIFSDGSVESDFEFFQY